MQVKVTKKMAAAIDRKIRPYGMRATYVEMDSDTYQEKVDFWYCCHANDVRPRGPHWPKVTLAAIRIDYPPEAYAIPRYLTTNCLKACFKYSDTTPDGFFQSVIDEISV